jgi:hypothetical protein
MQAENTMSIGASCPGKLLLRASALGALAFLSLGCLRSHTIEPGTWRLSIRPVESNVATGNRPIRPKHVEVTVGWTKEKDVEFVRVAYQKPIREEEFDASRPRVLAGRIKPELDNAGRELRKVSFMGADDHWELQFLGEVQHSQAMRGQVYARGRENDRDYFSGHWMMVKVQPSSAQTGGNGGGPGP